MTATTTEAADGVAKIYDWIHGRKPLVRLEGRALIKRLTTKKQEAIGARVEAQNLVRAIEAEQDAAVAAHEQATAPIQAELSKLDDERLASIIKNEPLAADFQERRAAAQERLTTANVALEKLSEDSRHRLTVARKAVDAARQHEAEYSQLLPDWLARAPFASPELTMAHMVAGNAVKYAEMRERAANEQVTKCQNGLAGAKQVQPQAMTMHNSDRNGNIVRSGIDHAAINHYTTGLKTWQFERDAATKALVEARREQARTYQAILDE